jgi:hypothetical protein
MPTHSDHVDARRPRCAEFRGSQRRRLNQREFDALLAWRWIMHRRILVSFLGSVLVLTPAAAIDTNAQQSQEQAQVTASGPEAGFFVYSGGGVLRKLARTQTTASQFNAANAWVTLPLAILARTVPSATTELFNVAFSAECQKILGGSARIRVLDTAGGVVSVLEPYDGAQVFCSSASAATHTGNWIKRAGAGTHTLQVQILQTAGVTVIDDWTFELVVYD